MMARPEAQRMAGALRASVAAAAKIDKTASDYITRFGRAWRPLRVRVTKARDRCENPKNRGFESYGGRGIRFVFTSTVAAALWVMENLGEPPAGMSLDRIDNDGHYAPGNLRWATSSEQNSNKRVYTRTAVGSRVRGLAALRPDLTEETIRTWVRKGLTDDEITSRRKHLGCGVRHT